MVRYWPEESMPRLIDNLSQANICLRRASIKALGAFGATVIPSLSKIFSNTKDRNLRTSCIKVFIHIAVQLDNEDFPEETICLIEKAMIDDSPELILTINSLLRQLGKQGIPLLLRASKDKNILRASSAMTALGEIEDPIVNSYLQSLLEEELNDPILKGSLLRAIQTAEQRD